jgi:hypothetical protein
VGVEATGFGRCCAAQRRPQAVALLGGAAGVLGARLATQRR